MICYYRWELNILILIFFVCLNCTHCRLHSTSITLTCIFKQVIYFWSIPSVHSPATAQVIPRASKDKCRHNDWAIENVKERVVSVVKVESTLATLRSGGLTGWMSYRKPSESKQSDVVGVKPDLFQYQTNLSEGKQNNAQIPAGSSREYRKVQQLPPFCAPFLFFSLLPNSPPPAHPSLTSAARCIHSLCCWVVLTRRVPDQTGWGSNLQNTEDNLKKLRWKAKKGPCSDLSGVSSCTQLLLTLKGGERGERVKEREREVQGS